MTTPYPIDLAAAKSEALARLLKIIRESPSETQVRLAAAAILRLPIPKVEPEVEAKPAPAIVVKTSALPTERKTSRALRDTHDNPALTPEEIAELRRLCPDIQVSTYTTPGMGNYWRAQTRNQQQREKHGEDDRNSNASRQQQRAA